MKVIVAGFPKTGTKSMNAALTRLGYRVYDFRENLFLLRHELTGIFNKGWTAQDFRNMYENVDAAMDLPIYFFWEEIHKAFPDAKIILTTRKDEDCWFESFRNQANVGGLTFKILSLLSPTNRAIQRDFMDNFFMTAVGLHPRPFWSLKFPMNKQLLTMKYRNHNAHVINNAPKDKLLVYQCSEGWGPLCNFLGHSVPDEPFPRKNVRGKVVEEIKQYPEIKKMQREVVVSSTVLLTIIIAMLYAIYVYMLF